MMNPNMRKTKMRMTRMRTTMAMRMTMTMRTTMKMLCRNPSLTMVAREQKTPLTPNEDLDKLPKHLEAWKDPSAGPAHQVRIPFVSLTK